MNVGMTYLVGAGPGDPGLITVRGLECLRSAEVVVYDRLANPALLREAPDIAELVFVGKESGRHALSQEEINQLLVDRASSGKTVVRLKGGDPFVFGRGGEEAEALIERDLPFEIIPGISSAVAAAAYAGIPVTHRDFTASFAVITGHEDPSKDISTVDWSKLATGVGTLVLLMGIGNLDEITRELIRHGRPPDTPVAIIRWATTPRQETVVGRLADIAQRAREHAVRPPAVTIVGDVVRLRDRLAWFDRRPLFGKRVLVTRTRDQASELSDRLRLLGAEPIEFPAIEVHAMPPGAPLDAALASLDSFDWVVLTSANGVRFIWERLLAAGRDARAFGRCRIAAIGPGTASALSRRGLVADYLPERFVAEAVAAGMPDVSGRRVLLPRADIAREALAVLLRERGAEVVEVAAYETRAASGRNGEIRRVVEAGVDVVTFTSSSTVTNLLERLHGQSNLLDRAVVASIGPITSRTAVERGLRVDVEASEHTIVGLVSAIQDYFKRRNRNHA